MKKIDAADVVVIGGGIMGVASAYFLGKKGKSVILCEARNLASGATGRCGGMVSHCHGRDLCIEHTMLRLMYTYENTRILRDFQAHEAKIDFEYRQIGSLDIATTEDDYEAIKRLYKIQKNVGDKEIILLDKKDLLECMPTLNPSLAIGARLRPSDGNLAPYKMTHAFAQIAQDKYHVKFMPFTPVRKIVEQDGVVKGVLTNNGFISSQWVVNATNAWARLLSPECDAVMPMRAFACVTEPIFPTPGYPWEAMVNGDYTYGSFQMHSQNLSFGGPARPDSLYSRKDNFAGYYQERIELDDLKRCSGYLAELFPSLKNTKIIRTWSGVMALAPDGAPLVGHSETTEGLVHCVSFYGGMANGAVFGRTVAEIIADDKTTFPISLFNPGRFKGIQYKGPEPWDLGLAYEYACNERLATGIKINYDHVAKINLDKPFEKIVAPGINLWNGWDWRSRIGGVDESFLKGEAVVCE
ncbi:MAG: FAD-binding oxidoreductase [Oscillospiraceae bacterium]|nr:FAD-binding oxidoreductase [Oscillospiraceae bacterium]